MRARARRTTGALAAGALAALLAGTIAAPASSQPGGTGGPAVGPATTPATTPNPADPTDGTDAVEGSRWTLANLPDTQFYSRYAADQFEPRYGSNPYLAQTEWLADVHDELNIPFVTHVGDVVDRAGVENEWAAADAAHRVLEEAGLPYSILPGNHDLTNSGANDTELGPDEPYLQWFTPERSAAQSPNSGRDATGFSEYHVFEAEGQEYLVLSLAWRTSDETLEWADQVMADHPTLPTILVSHEILGVDSDGVTAVTGGNGQRLWDGLIHDNDQIFLTLSGHNHGSTHRVVENDNGQEVIQVLQDWQMHYEGGNGYLGLLEFDLDNDAIHVSAPSPWVVGKPEDALTMHDRPMLEAENEEYSVAIDFEERFAGFNPDWEPGDGADTSLTERARALILDGFDGVPPVDRDVPGSTEDFVRTEGTVAHWRPNLVDAEIGDVLPEGAVLPDAVLEEQAMTRGPISTSPTAQEEDVTLCEGHAFSSSASGICFANSSNSDNRFSYFATESDVPVTDVEFDDGYTIEAFINIAEGWTAEENAWTRALARSGNRSRIPGMAQIWDYEQAPASIGFSNLREFQWTVVPEDPTTGDRTAWSGEITSDDWYHLAMVNDPEDGSVTMYVDGMPILRNISDGNGMSFEEGYPWMIGAGTNDDEIGSGWHGGVGEVRVIDRATEPGEWLIDRPDVAAFTAPTAELESDADGALPALTGTGQPGATVVSDGAVTGETVVAEDGSWTLEGVLVDPTATGTHEFSLTHGFGERRSEAVAGQVTVPDDGEEPEEPGEPGEPTEPAPGVGFYLNDGWDARAEHEFSYGRVGDEVLVGDWDGDGSDSLAVRRGNSYYFTNSLYGGNADVELNYGRAGDVVLVGDWDGDGVDTLAVRRGNAYFVSNSLESGWADEELTYGQADDDVLVGDFDGDAVDTFTVRRGNTYFISNTLTSGWADSELDYGRASDEVYVGDWDGDGVDSFAVRRGNSYFLSNSLTSGWADEELDYGQASDDVLVGDYDGDAVDTFTVRRGNTYFISNTLQSGWAESELDYGRASDEVYVGDWDGDATDSFAVRRGITFFVSNSLTSTVAEIEQDYGRSGDEVFVGDWNGDNADTLGIRR